MQLSNKERDQRFATLFYTYETPLRKSKHLVFALNHVIIVSTTLTHIIQANVITLVLDLPIIRMVREKRWIINQLCFAWDLQQRPP